MGDKYSKIQTFGNEENSFSLYVGPCDYLAAEETLKELRIQCVVTCSLTLLLNTVECLNRNNISDENIYHMYMDDFHHEDFDAESVRFDEVTEWIHTKLLEGKTTLIHCDGGVTRSPSTCMAYYMRYGEDLHNISTMTREKAYNVVCEKRDKIDTTMYTSLLIQWEHENAKA
jgi:protein-tyrosine phosphatase